LSGTCRANGTPRLSQARAVTPEKAGAQAPYPPRVLPAGVFVGSLGDLPFAGESVDGVDGAFASLAGDAGALVGAVEVSGAGLVEVVDGVAAGSLAGVAGGGAEVEFGDIGVVLPVLVVDVVVDGPDIAPPSVFGWSDLLQAANDATAVSDMAMMSGLMVRRIGGSPRCSDVGPD
jgi:hypothetical protein